MLSRTCTENSKVPIMLRNELWQYHPRVRAALFFFDDKFPVEGRKSESHGQTVMKSVKGGRRSGASKASERTCQPRAEVRKTTTGLFFFHPVWITIIPPSIVYCGGELFYYRSVGRTRILSERVRLREGRGEGERCRRERGYTRGRMTMQHPVISRFIDLTRENHEAMKN